jgi:prepilin-type N-terminal cleavage/methylation domain-containing protein
MKKTSPALKQAFSLVEMLMVLAIMSALAVFTMSSGNQMVDVFAMARQNSISKNDYTAIVILAQGASAYRAYCLMEWVRPDDGSLGQWTELTPWRFLPQGTVFEPVNGSSNLANDTFISSSVTALPTPTFPPTFPTLPTNLSFQGQAIDLSSSANAVVQYYQPDGTLSTQPQAGLILRLVEGQVNPSSGALTYQGSSYYDLVFVSNTGVTKIRRP